MGGQDSGFLEGDRPDQSRSGALVFRIAAFLKPYRRLVAVAALLILVSIGLELALPFFSRTAIDSYLVPYSLRLDTSRISSVPEKELKAFVPEGVIRSGETWYVPEKSWRKLDPGLIARLRTAGAVDSRRWYFAPADGKMETVAARNPGMFVRAENGWLIADDNLQTLPGQDLKELRRSDAHGLIVLALLFAAVAVSTLVVSYFQTVCLEQAGQRMMMDLRLSLYSHILSRSLIFFSRNPVGKLVTRINNDAQNIADLFQGMLVGLLKDLLLFAGIAAVMFALNASLAAACMLVAPLMAIVTYYFARVARNIFRRLKGYTGRVNTLLQETLAGMTAVKLMGAESAILDKLARMNTCYYRAGLAQVKMFAVFGPLMELLGSLAVAMIIWRGGGNVIQDRLSLGTLTAFVAYMQMLLVPVRNLSEQYNQLQGALASVERIFSVLGDETALPVASPPRHGSHLAADAEIVFRGVHFRYDDHRSVFSGLDLTIPKGQTVTLVGPSGGGKSTLVNLALRLYDPREGTILLHGKDLKAIPPRELARYIALVSQEIILLASSIEENITLGREDITPEMVANAVEISGVAAWVNDLSEGMKTRIGDGGRQLSQGQCQMLSLARALAGNPHVLVLDEALNQIDPESERLIAARLPSIMAGRTCIMVAHRLSTARHSERILVMRNGRILEDGDHRTLVDAKGIYADMAALDQSAAEPDR